MSDPLIERVAAAVASAYRDVVDEGCAGVLLAPDWYGEPGELAPFALELTEVDEFVGRDGYQEELGWPELDDETLALCEQLTRRVESEDDGQTLLDVFWLVLAQRMHALLGIPVLVEESEMPIEEQLRRQLGTEPDPDPLAGLDVLLSVRIDEHRVAAVFTGGLGGLETYAIGRVGHPGDAHEVGPWATEISRDPQILAGKLPGGAAGVVVRDRAGTWHEATVASGVWLCVLPQRSGQEDPPYEWRDARGLPYTPGEDDFIYAQPPDLRADEGAVRAGARVPALWSYKAQAGPYFAGWEGPREAATALRFDGAEWVVRISAGDAPAVADVYRERLMKQLRYTAKHAARRLRQIPAVELPGSVDGTPVAFALAAPSEPWLRDDGWAAVAACDGYAITVQCGGAPPERLDFESIRR